MQELSISQLKLWLSRCTAQQGSLVLNKLAQQIQFKAPNIDLNDPLWAWNLREAILIQAEQYFVDPQQNTAYRDLRGIPCPMNSAKARVYLSKLPPFSETEIWLDSGAPIENVPGSLIADGHQIISRQRKENYWIIKVKRKR